MPLDNFYATLKNGTTVAAFLRQYDEMIKFIHNHRFTEDYRLGKHPMKQLRDEVTPVARFVRLHAGPEDRIRFALGNTYPDCVVCRQDGRTREIEVTVAQAQERRALMTELNEKAIARAYLGLSDDVPYEAFKNAMGREEQAYSSDEVFSCIEHAVDLCIRNKRKYCGDTLLIEAPLETLPCSQWEEFPRRFVHNEKLKALCFSEVYVTGFCGDGSGKIRDICPKIK